MSPAYRNSLDLVRIRTALLAVLACALAALAANAAGAAPCSFEAQGEGRVAAIIDARSFRLTDGREKGHLGGPVGHKKRGKYRRYLGREWALYAGGRQGSVGPAGRGNDLPQLRPELDTGFRCDYFTAHATVS